MTNLILFLMLLTIFFSLMPKTGNNIVDQVIFPMFAVAMGVLVILFIILVAVANAVVLIHG